MYFPEIRQCGVLLVYLRVSVFLILVQEQGTLYVNFYMHFYEHRDPNSLSIYWNENSKLNIFL